MLMKKKFQCHKIVNSGLRWLLIVVKIPQRKKD